MKQDILQFIRHLELFKNLSVDILNQIIQNLPIETLPENKILFYQDEESDAVYIVLHGFFSAEYQKENNEMVLMGFIKAGESIGELGFFTKKPRSLTIKSITEATVLKLNQESWDYFNRLVPSISQAVLMNVIHRNQNVIQLAVEPDKKKRGRYIMLALADQTDAEHFFHDEMEKFSQSSSIVLLDMAHLIKLFQQTDGRSLVLEYLEKIETDYEALLLIYNYENKDLNDLLVKKTDVITVIAYGHHKPRLLKPLRELLEQPNLKNYYNQFIQKHLIICWPTHLEITYTRFWLQLTKFDIHHHVKTKTDVERVIRFWQGRAFGVVFGGGASRGWTHLGVLQALKEKNISIDALGGTSAGAGAAACYLMTKTQEELIDVVHFLTDSIKKSLSWRYLTLPRVSFFSALPFVKALREVFKEKRIEDLPVPFFAVSTNVNRNCETVDKSGILWRVLRSTSAIPVFFPPLLENGEVLYDGGLLNNLPVDHMRRLLGEKGIILASDLGTLAIDDKQYKFPAALPLQKIIYALVQHEYLFPPFFSTVVKAMLLGAIHKYNDNIALANYYVHPEFKETSLVEFENKNIEQLIRIGYEETLKVLG